MQESAVEKKRFGVFHFGRLLKEDFNSIKTMGNVMTPSFLFAKTLFTTLIYFLEKNLSEIIINTKFSVRLCFMTVPLQSTIV